MFGAQLSTADVGLYNHNSEVTLGVGWYNRNSEVTLESCPPLLCFSACRHETLRRRISVLLAIMMIWLLSQFVHWNHITRKTSLRVGDVNALRACTQLSHARRSGPVTSRILTTGKLQVLDIPSPLDVHRARSRSFLPSYWSMMFDVFQFSV